MRSRSFAATILQTLIAGLVLLAILVAFVLLAAPRQADGAGYGLDCGIRHALTVEVRDDFGDLVARPGLHLTISPDPLGWRGTRNVDDQDSYIDDSAALGRIRLLDACATTEGSNSNTYAVPGSYRVILTTDEAQLVCDPRFVRADTPLREDTSLELRVRACSAATPTPAATATATASPTPTETPSPPSPTPTATPAPHVLIACLPSGTVVDITLGQGCPAALAATPVLPAPVATSAPAPIAPPATTVPAPGAPAIRPPQTGDAGLVRAK